MRRRWKAALGLCGLLSARLLVGASASAQPTVPCAITVADVTSPAGSLRVIVGDNFPTTPRTVPIMLSGRVQVGIASVNDAGHFSVSVRIPLDARRGVQTVSAACGPGGEATSQIDVVAARSATEPRVPDDNVSGAGLVVGGVVAVGAALALTTRRRRTQRLLTH